MYKNTCVCVCVYLDRKKRISGIYTRDIPFLLLNYDNIVAKAPKTEVWFYVHYNICHILTPPSRYSTSWYKGRSPDSFTLLGSRVCSSAAVASLHIRLYLWRVAIYSFFLDSTATVAWSKEWKKRRDAQPNGSKEFMSGRNLSSCIYMRVRKQTEKKDRERVKKKIWWKKKKNTSSGWKFFQLVCSSGY